MTGDPPFCKTVLDAYIIEEIKRQEEQRRREDERARPRLRIEIPSKRVDPEVPAEAPSEDQDEPDSVIRIGF